MWVSSLLLGCSLDRVGAEASRVVVGVGEGGGWWVVYFDGPGCGSLTTHGSRRDCSEVSSGSLDPAQALQAWEASPNQLTRLGPTLCRQQRRLPLPIYLNRHRYLSCPKC